MTPEYTFVSVSTAKPGRLDDLIRVASAPSEHMEGRVEGLVARQVSVDRERNTVVVWVAFDRRETLYDWLETPEGQAGHAADDLDAIIETFEMYDLTPVSQRL